MITPQWFQKAIALLPERCQLNVSGAPIEYLTWGLRGRPGILLLHGSMAHADWWRFIAPFFADDFRVAAFSFSGMGNSGRREHYSQKLFVEEALAVAEAAGLFEVRQSPAIVAHSAGGGPAVCLAARRRFSGAAIIDTVIRSTNHHPGPLKQNRIYPSVDAAAARYRLMPPQPHSNPYIIDFLARTGLRQEEGGWTWAFDPKTLGHLSERDAWEILPSLRCPLFLLNGARSVVTAPDRWEKMRLQLPPGTSIFTIPEAHHHVQVDQPIALITALRMVLSGLYGQPINWAAGQPSVVS